MNRKKEFEKRIEFSKMHGLGNDFMIIDGVTQSIQINAEIVQRWADRHTGVGFDQLLLVEPPLYPDVDFHYRIFNADGSEVEQCGNGARCLARFVQLRKLTRKKVLKVSTLKEVITLTINSNNTVLVDIGTPIFEPSQIPFKASSVAMNYILRVDTQTVLCSVVSMGNPHCVIQVDDIDAVDVAKLGHLIAHHERFPQQANVGFMEIITPNHIRLRVYERGVGETNACGTGACAAVAIGIQQGLLAQCVQVDLLGGQLNIEWKGGDTSLTMEGAATFVYDGAISTS